MADSTAIRRQVTALLKRMTLREKITQLMGIEVIDLLEGDELSEAKMQQHLAHGIGQISKIGGALPQHYSPAAATSLHQRIQGFLQERTRLGIPAIVHEECLSGYMARQATCFPQALAMACTWDPELVQTVADSVRRDMVAGGAHQGFGPVLDICRDPRWGRIEETYGEDPYLIAALGTAFVRGLQGSDLREGIIATGKHFLAYGASEGARNLASVYLAPRELAMYAYPFECVIRLAGLQSVMNAYHDLDGVPCAGSKHLLTDILRNKMGFDGLVVADYGSILQLHANHRVAVDTTDAAVQALEAGVDLELPKGDCYLTLEKAIKSKRLSMKTLNQAVSRVLTAKARLGLLAPGSGRRQPPQTPPVFDTPAHRALARRAAEEAIVLLKNDGILPLSGREKLLLTGPNAADPHAMLGDYSMTSLSAFFLKTKPGWNELKVATVREGLQRQMPPGSPLRFELGCDREGNRRDGFPAALEHAKKSDAIVAVMGEESMTISGEGRDATDLRLPGIQEEYLLALAAIGKPLILVLVNGHPIDLGRIEPACAAIVEAWYPGEEGGNAIADILLGKTNPSGKLAVSLLKEVGQAPLPYAGRSQGREGINNAWCRAGTPAPRYPFGHGLSYTTFAYEQLRITPKTGTGRGEFAVSCRIQNTGSHAGTEVVQLYVRDEVASIAPRIMELKGFARVPLESGKSKTVRFTMPAELLAFPDRDMRLKVEAGDYAIWVGASANDIRLKGTIRVSADRFLPKRTRFLTTAAIK